MVTGSYAAGSSCGSADASGQDCRCLARTGAPAVPRAYDVALLDLDGVVYVGPDAVPGAPEALAQARSRGMRLAFVTNNAARPPTAVAAI